MRSSSNSCPFGSKLLASLSLYLEDLLIHYQHFNGFQSIDRSLELDARLSSLTLSSCRIGRVVAFKPLNPSECGNAIVCMPFFLTEHCDRIPRLISKWKPMSCWQRVTTLSPLNGDPCNTMSVDALTESVVGIDARNHRPLSLQSTAEPISSEINVFRNPFLTVVRFNA